MGSQICNECRGREKCEYAFTRDDHCVYIGIEKAHQVASMPSFESFLKEVDAWENAPDNWYVDDMNLYEFLLSIKEKAAIPLPEWLKGRFWLDE